MASKKNPLLHLSIENVGDSQYLQDHHNRKRESLLYLSFAGGESIADILEVITDEIDQDDKIPANFVVDKEDVLSLCQDIREELTAYDESEIDIQLLATW